MLPTKTRIKKRLIKKVLAEVTVLFEKANCGNEEAAKALSIWASRDLNVKKMVHSLRIEAENKIGPIIQKWPEGRPGGWKPYRK